MKRGKQDGWGAVGNGGRVKFLPLAWAGMPKTSFRKNSDSPNKQALRMYRRVSEQVPQLKNHYKNV
jgi:hypothetical protein